MSNILCYGLGTIGRGAMRTAMMDPDVTVVGAVDVDPGLIGADLGVLVGLEPCGIAVQGSLREALEAAPHRPDVCIHATGSRIRQVRDQLVSLVNAGLSVSTSSEEMLFPWRADPDFADRLHELAARRHVCVYATGVNPGFSLDRLPAAVTAVVANPRRILARRISDTATRRPQLRAKTGAGLDPAAFEAAAARDRIGHVGLWESFLFLLRALHGRVAEAKRTLQPVIADRAVELPEGTLQVGHVAGAREEIHARLQNGLRIGLVLQLSVGAPDPVDEVIVEGTPPIHTAIAGGLAGEPATLAALVHGAHLATELPPGISRV